MQAEIRAVLEPWCAARTVEEMLRAMRAGNVPIGSARSIVELIRNPADARAAMSTGTASFTAMLAVLRLTAWRRARGMCW